MNSSCITCEDRIDLFQPDVQAGLSLHHLYMLEEHTFMT